MKEKYQHIRIFLGLSSEFLCGIISNYLGIGVFLPQSVCDQILNDIMTPLVKGKFNPNVSEEFLKF